MKSIEILIAVFTFICFPGFTQENPFPLTQNQVEELFQKNKHITNRFLGENGYSQKKLSAMSKKDRETFIIAKARQLVLSYGPAYYRDYKEPVIEEIVSEQGGEEDFGKKRYRVKFPYDASKEKFSGEFSAVVTFMENGTTHSVSFGGSTISLMYPPYIEDLKDVDQRLKTDYQPLKEGEM